MPFTNAQIDVQELPRLEELSFSPIEKQDLTASLIGTGILWLFLFIVAIIFIQLNELNYPSWWNSLGLGVISLFAVLHLIYDYFAYSRKGYAIRMRDIIFRKGVFWKSITSVPFSRIQHCEVKEGPIDRLFKLASLHLYTAGGSSSDLKIPGLKPSKANDIKQFVLKKIKSEEEE